MSAAYFPVGDSSVLLTEGLTRRYGDFVALEPISLRIARGELVALVGPNGAGKTTLMTMIAGLLEPTDGLVTVEGHEAGSLPARAAISYVPDSPVLYDDLSLNEHLEYIAGLHGVRDWGPQGEMLLRRLGLEAWGERLPTEFSRGMRQKAAIAIGLIRPFSLLVADEPFDGLDPASRAVLFDLFEETRRSGSAVLVSTHRSDVVEIAGRCVVLSDGALTHDGRLDPQQLVEIVSSEDAMGGPQGKQTGR